MPSERPGNPIVRKPPQQKPPQRRKPAPPTRSDVASGGGYAPTKPPPQRKPAPPTQPDIASGYSAPKKPAAPAPPVYTDARLRPPDPALQKYGINRSLPDFNDTLERSQDLFYRAHNRLPSPGLLYDIARSDFGLPDLPHLFQVPDSHAQARAAGGVRRDQQENPFDYFHQRADGRWDLASPIDQFLGGQLDTEARAGIELKGYRSAQVQRETPSGGLAPATVETPMYGKARVYNVHKDYPMVSEASLPIPGWDQFWKAAVRVNKVKLSPAETTLYEHGKTLSDYEYHLQQAGLDKVQRKYGKEMSAVQTVKGGQTELQKVAPDYFGQLPATGYLNSDWAKQIKLYKGSIEGAQRQVEFDAKQAGLSPHDYVQAWRNKEKVLKQNPGTYQIFAGMDLKLFVHKDSFVGGAGDLANYLLGDFSWSSPTSYLAAPFHVMGNTAGLGMQLIGGTLNETKAYAAAMRIAMTHGANAYKSSTKTKDEMDAELRKALTGHPSWGQVFGIHMPNWADQLTNTLGDVVLLGAPKFTGEFVPWGDFGKAVRSRYLNSTADLAWRQIRKHGTDGVASAAHLLESESGRGAERLMEATAKDIAAGKLSKSEFQQMVAHQYAHGWVPFADKEIHGGLLHSLSTKDLPTKNPVWQGMKVDIKDVLNTVDASFRRSSVVGTTGAADYLMVLRNLWQHSYPLGGVRGFHEPKVPQRIADWTKGELKDPKLAAKWENDFVRARARDDVPGMQNVFDQMDAVYAKKFPGRKGGAREQFDALFLTEAPSRGYFPAGGVREVHNPWDGMVRGAQGANQWALKVTAKHRQVIVSGAPFPIPGVVAPPFGAVLFEKHLVGDTLRRAVGGGLSLRFEKAAYDDLMRVATTEGNEGLLRELRHVEARVKPGETRYYLPVSKEDPWTDSTATQFASDKHMTAAGGYVRRIFMDDAIGPLSRSTPDNLEPLIQFMRSHPQYRNLVAGKVRREGGGVNVQMARNFPPNDEAFAAASYKDQASAMYRRFQEIVDGAKQAGVSDPLQAIRQIMHSTKGDKIDQALGKWVQDNKVEFKVRSGLVERPGGALDSWSQKYIGWLMAPNKYNRAGMFKHVLAKTYKGLREAGWSEKDALESALGLSERQTVHHLLDFANMLKVEQDFRWASYFATKHRLYWKWVVNQVWRRPGLAVVANDFKNNLDSRGNVTFELFGQRFGIPIPRLLWLNSLELPDVSTPVIGAAGFLEGLKKGKNPFAYAWSHAVETSGNILTRDDQAWIAGYHFVQALRGKTLSYEGATAGMGSKQKTIFNHLVNEFQTDYYHAHGAYAPEPDTVKWALMHTVFQEASRANFAAPVWMPGPSQAQQNAQQKLWEQFSRITSGPKRTDFLLKHPALSNQIAQGKDPAVYVHNQEFFRRFRDISTARDDARKDIYQKALHGGWTGDLELQWRKVGKDFNAAMRQIELDDASHWPGSPTAPKGVVRDGQVVKPGPFGLALQGNPFLARKQWLHYFPNTSPQELKAKTIGQTVEVLQAERNFLQTPQGRKTYKDQQALKDRLAEINDRLAHFQGYPKTAAEKFHSLYYDQVNAYRAKRDAWRNRIKALPSDRQDRAYEELRAWEDTQDKAVTVTVGDRAVRFPSPVRVGYAVQTPDERRATLARWASDNWNHLSNFAKHTLTGQQIDPAVSKGQLLYQLALSGLSADAHARKRLLEEYSINVPVLPPGASLDANQKLAIARQIGRAVGNEKAFMADYHFAQRPTVERLKTYRFVQKDAHWQDLFDQVSYFLNAAKKAGYTGRERTITDVYRRQIIPQLKARVATEGSQFKNEIAFFVQQNPNFWNGLIAP